MTDIAREPVGPSLPADHEGHGLRARRRPTPPGGTADAAVWSWAGPGSGGRLRSLPYRPARGGWRSRRAQAASRPGPRDRRHGCEARSRRRQLGDEGNGSASRGWAGRAANATTAPAVRRTSVTEPGSPVTRSTAGYAEYTVADARYCFPIPESFSDFEAAPLLCAGLIGFRSLRMTGEARRLGLYGFGAAAHIIAQVARHQGSEVYAFTRPGDKEGQAFARRLGAVWAGDSDEPSSRRARCGHTLRPSRRPAAALSSRGSQGRHRGMRRHPHE